MHFPARICLIVLIGLALTSCGSDAEFNQLPVVQNPVALNAGGNSGHDYELIPTSVYYWYDPYASDLNRTYTTGVSFRFVDRAELARMRAEAELALQHAQAALAKAEAERRIAAAERAKIHETMLALQKEIENLKAEQKSAALSLERLKLYAKSMNALKRGSASKQNILALNYLLQAGGDARWLEKEEVNAFSEEQFIANGKTTWVKESDGKLHRRSNVAAAFSGRKLNAKAYLEFLENHQQNPKLGSDAQIALSKIVDKSLGNLERRFAALEANMDQGRADFEEKWRGMEELCRRLQAI